MSRTLTALFDACVLYSAVKRDVLVDLATTDLVRARWSARIHDEWTAAVRANYPGVAPDKLARTRELMDQNVLDCLVTGYEDLIDSLDLPDPDDRHVLAAAIRAGAQVIVTTNTRHFPAEQLGRYGIETQTHDEFVAGLLAVSPATVCASLRRVRLRWKNPPCTADELLTKLEAQGFVRTVALLAPWADAL